PRVAALNPGMNLPGLPIKRIVREDASGSTEVWTRYLGQSSAKFASAVPVSQKPAWPGSTLSAKGHDGGAALLQDTPGGPSYVPFGRVPQDRPTGAATRHP
ncbi:hypothetical protein, partial [Tenacibaculum discolor]|uniref:hypothetical protein n=1 Tax=Tenacibaculum discolor TaxID=361581 RepID=UPI00191C7D9A